jgi:hypothetical protein
MKFQIINKTKFPTRSLRAFVVRAYPIAVGCAGQRRVASFELGVGRIRITLARSNRRGNGHSTGHAYLNSGRAHVGIADAPNKRDVARVLAHEFGHCFGMRHDEMSGGPLWGIGMSEEQRGRLYGWADALPLAHKPAKRKPVGDERRTLKLAGIASRLKSWQSKRKRADTAIKKLNVQQRRLMRQGDTPCSESKTEKAFTSRSKTATR